MTTQTSQAKQPAQEEPAKSYRQITLDEMIKEVEGGDDKRPCDCWLNVIKCYCEEV